MSLEEVDLNEWKWFFFKNDKKYDFRNLDGNKSQNYLPKRDMHIQNRPRLSIYDAQHSHNLNKQKTDEVRSYFP